MKTIFAALSICSLFAFSVVAHADEATEVYYGKKGGVVNIDSRLVVWSIDWSYVHISVQLNSNNCVIAADAVPSWNNESSPPWRINTFKCQLDATELVTRMQKDGYTVLRVGYGFNAYSKDEIQPSAFVDQFDGKSFGAIPVHVGFVSDRDVDYQRTKVLQELKNGSIKLTISFARYKCIIDGNDVSHLRTCQRITRDNDSDIGMDCAPRIGQLIFQV